MTGRRPYRLAGIITFSAGVLFCIFGLWFLFAPAEYSATAELDDLPDTDLVEKLNIRAYDVCLAGFEAKELISDKVLKLAVSKLDTIRTVRALRRHLKTCVVHRCTIEVIATAHNPMEAAKIANIVSDVYRDTRTREFGAWRRSVLQEELTIYKGRLARLTASSPDKTREDLQAFVARLESDINNARDEPSGIIRRAVPPAEPSGPNRLAGKILLASGIILVFSAFPLVTSARRS